MNTANNENDTNNQPPSTFSILIDIFASPAKAFENIKYDFPILPPLLLLISLNVILILTLYSNLDYPWFVDRMVELTAGDLSNSEKEASRQAFEMMSPNTMGGIGAFSLAVITLVIFSIMSLYFVVVSNITNDGFQFKQWFSLVTWSSLPSLLSTLASFAIIFSSNNGQIAAESLNPFTLNELIFGLNPTKGMGAFYASIDITMIWSIALLTIGYSRWTGKEMTKSFFIAATPYALFFAIRYALV